MSSTCAFRVHDVCGRMCVNGASETSPSLSSKEPGSRTAIDAALPSPTRSDSTRASRLQAPSVREACRDKKASQSSRQATFGPAITSPSPLHSIYGLWCTCAYDAEDSQIVLPLAPCLNEDIFGVGKRLVQREVEMDGCVRLVFVEE